MSKRRGAAPTIGVVVVSNDGREYTTRTLREFMRLLATGYRPKTGTIDANIAALVSSSAVQPDANDPVSLAALADPASAAMEVLKAALGSADPVLSDFVYDGATGNLISYKEDGIAVVLTYNADGTVATQKRGDGPVRAFTYSGGNLAGVS